MLAITKTRSELTRFIHAGFLLTLLYQPTCAIAVTLHPPLAPATFKAGYGCVGRLWDGTIIPLDCSFTHQVHGLTPPATAIANNGGHNHDFIARPLIDPPWGVLTSTGGDLDPSALGVKGFTRRSMAVVTHPMPEVAGSIRTEFVIKSPPGWYVRSSGATSVGGTITLDVGIHDLEPLPASSDYHILVRGGTDTHPEGAWGTRDTVDRAVFLAKVYFKATGYRLSINDMSLPKGGLFDINADWAPPHNGHRTGTAMDINRADESGVRINCADDDKLKDAVREANKQRPPIRLLRCSAEQTQGHKHVDFD